MWAIYIFLYLYIFRNKILLFIFTKASNDLVSAILVFTLLEIKSKLLPVTFLLDYPEVEPKLF